MKNSVKKILGVAAIVLAAPLFLGGTVACGKDCKGRCEDYNKACGTTTDCTTNCDAATACSKEADAVGLVKKEGDTVTLIYSLPGAPMPTEFKTKPGQHMFVLKSTTAEKGKK